MIMTEIKQYVAEVAVSEDPNFSTIASFLQQVIEQIESGAISGSEAEEILQDIKLQVEIMHEMSDLQLKEKLNVALNALITVASMAV